MKYNIWYRFSLKCLEKMWQWHENKMTKCFGTQITRFCLQKSRNTKIQKQYMHFVTLTQDPMPFWGTIWKMTHYIRSHLVLVKKQLYTENCGVSVTAYTQYLECTKSFFPSQKALPQRLSEINSEKIHLKSNRLRWK